ncbi:MAG TPA: STAS domain-containing protein [Candidatus Eisenbacteria bacterium]|nr:STAS domain-containing protein [Candidatus Eisenbacteria bacterium]
MPTTTSSRIPEIVRHHEEQLLSEWVQRQLAALTARRDLIQDDELREQSRRFLIHLRDGLQRGGLAQEVGGAAWAEMRDLLSAYSLSRARMGFSPSETATFVFSFKQPLYDRLRDEVGDDPSALQNELWAATVLLDRLGLHTVELYQRNREEVIRRQQDELSELSTPVVQLWDGILALPVIGTLDSSRTQTVMENLLEKIVQTGATHAILDITGVPTVDTLVAQHLLKTVAAARLMGAECIISGIRPQIAQTIVHLGVDLGDVTTKSTLADAFAVALHKSGMAVTRNGHRALPAISSGPSSSTPTSSSS